ILTCTDDQNMIFIPAQDLGNITINKVLDAIRRHGQEMDIVSDSTEKQIDATFAEIERASGPTGNQTISEWVGQSNP
ncbi:hypothetical protein KKA47_03660, partial [bacterium]|nr:hypothetical protein [bacterium]